MDGSGPPEIVAQTPRSGPLWGQERTYPVNDREHDKQDGPVKDAPHPLVFDWLGALPWRCPRCGAEMRTAEMTPRCERCGYRDAAD